MQARAEQQTYLVRADATGIHWQLSVGPEDLSARQEQQFELRIRIIAELEPEEDGQQLSFRFE